MESLKNFNDSMVCAWQYDYECFKLSKYFKIHMQLSSKYIPKLEKNARNPSTPANKKKKDILVFKTQS